MEVLRFHCHSCHGEIIAPSEFSGVVAPCPMCGELTQAIERPTPIATPPISPDWWANEQAMANMEQSLPKPEPRRLAPLNFPESPKMGRTAVDPSIQATPKTTQFATERKNDADGSIGPGPDLTTSQSLDGIDVDSVLNSLLRAIAIVTQEAIVSKSNAL